jgi:hypothetical protein
VLIAEGEGLSIALPLVHEKEIATLNPGFGNR